MRKNPSWIIVSQKAAADISFQALIPAVVLTALAFLTVGLRWWSRVRFSGGWGVEDVLVTFALVCIFHSERWPFRRLTAKGVLDSIYGNRRRGYAAPNLDDHFIGLCTDMGLSRTSDRRGQRRRCEQSRPARPNHEGTLLDSQGSHHIKCSLAHVRRVHLLSHFCQLGPLFCPLPIP